MPKSLLESYKPSILQIGALPKSFRRMSLTSLKEKDTSTKLKEKDTSWTK